MVKFRFAVMASAVLCLAAGCATADPAEKQTAEQPAISVIAKNDHAAADKQGKIIGVTLLKALKTNKFELADSLKIGDGKKQLTKEKFTALCERINKQGGVADYVYLGSLGMKPYRRLMWKVVLGPQTPDAEPSGIDIVFEVLVGKVDNAYRAVGFGFRP